MNTLAQEIEEQDKYYSVIVDGNNHPGVVNIKTAKEQITVKKCQDLVAKIESTFGIIVGKIQILMTQWDYKSLTPEAYSYALSGDIGIKTMGPEKYAKYYKATNCLQIWENGLPVYENNDGVICDDPDTLADCLC